MKIFGFLIIIGSAAAHNSEIAGLGGWVMQSLNTVQDIAMNNNGSSNNTEPSKLNLTMITPDNNNTTSAPNDDRIINATEFLARFNIAPQDNSEGFGDRLPQLKLAPGQIRQKWPISHIELTHDDIFPINPPEVEFAKANDFATIAQNKDLNSYREHHFDVDYSIIPHEESAEHYHEEIEDLGQYNEHESPEEHHYGDDGTYFGHHYDSIPEEYARK